MADALTTENEFRVLADGRRMPMLGLGVWQVPPGRDCENAVRWALEAGYRHIDTAQAYGNEESVGRALRESGVPREQVWITTKFYPGHQDPVLEAEKSLRRLGVESVDLYIVHWPQGGPTWAWEGMERALERGLTGAIGVSNFSAEQIEQVCSVANARPLVNQVQFSAFEHRRALLEACHERGIALEGYSSLGTGKHLGDRTVVQIAERLARTPAQVLLRCCIQHDVIVIPKSTHRERIEENARLFDFEIPAGDMARLDALDRTGYTAAAREQQWW